MDTNWLEAAQENFREAMDRKDWDMAEAVRQDVEDEGFAVASIHMRDQLNGELPSAPHGYVLAFLKKKNEEYKAKGLVPTLDLLIEDLTK